MKTLGRLKSKWRQTKPRWCPNLKHPLDFLHELQLRRRQIDVVQHVEVRAELVLLHVPGVVFEIVDYIRWFLGQDLLD